MQNLQQENLEQLYADYPVPEPGFLDSSYDTLMFTLESLTSTKYDPDARERLFRMGVIEDPDAITESTAMAVLRDLNFFVRALVNPAISGLENLGFLDRLDAGEEVDTILPAARVELTEKVPWYDVIGMGDAYLREILIETATMRSLGNDIGQLKSVGVLGIPLIDEDTGGAGSYVDYVIPDALIPSRDFLVGVGTAGS